MGTVTASTGDTYSTVTSCEAIVGVDDGLGGAVATGTSCLNPIVRDADPPDACGIWNCLPWKK